MKSTFVYASCLALSLALTACSDLPGPADINNGVQSSEVKAKEGPWADIKHAVAVVHPTEGHQVKGVVHLTETAEGKVKIVADLTGLSPNQEHGFHLHEFGDCSSPDASSAGDHYNPAGHPHALPSGEPRHAGDFGNVKSDASGNAHFELTTDTITLAGGRHPALGRAIIVHAQPDTGAQPSGNAGPRVGCGVVGITDPSATQ